MSKHIVLMGWIGVLAFGVVAARGESAPDWFLSLPCG